MVSPSSPSRQKHPQKLRSAILSRSHGVTLHANFPPSYCTPEMNHRLHPAYPSVVSYATTGSRPSPSRSQSSSVSPDGLSLEAMVLTVISFQKDPRLATTPLFQLHSSLLRMRRTQCIHVHATTECTQVPTATATATLAATSCYRGCRTDTDQQDCKTRQSCSPVGSASDSDISGDGRVVMTSFKFSRESPAHKSVPLSPAQRQGTLNVAARPFMLPDVGGIDIGAIKKPCQ
ncbi:hypothetical protein EDB87DRAFT_201458 [Lactarius vividus]|nr:hypothetical protein EDB87DRAFT_201458 [Lactarius vividus]